VTAPALAELIERMTGLALDRGGVSKALDRFVAHRMRALGLTMVESYVQIAADPTRGEQRKLIDAITVPHTWFYRDPEQLGVIARLIAAASPGPLSIWVAGCATGEEAYTLAMIGRSVGRQVWIHATDVNEAALAAARRGVYSALSVRDVPDTERHWLVPGEAGFAVHEALRSSVRFERHNLVDPPPPSPRGAWDLVICRNVLIYFAPSAATRLLARFARAVREGGAVVVGASEVVFEPPPGLELVSSDSRLVLRRPARPSPPRIIDARGTPPGSLPTADLVPLPTPTATPVAMPVATPAPARLLDLVAALGRGHSLFERGEIAAAIEVYDELVREHPAVAEVWLYLGIARYTHGEIEEATSALRASLCLDTTLWPAGFYLARAYERLGRRADALQQYDLIAVDDLQPLALHSQSAVINELRALRYDVRNAARRLTGERNRKLY
jgi:chemotaxis methyl-accepting protein methylase